MRHTRVIALFDLLKQQKIKPLIAHRFPLVEARHARELLGKGGVTGKIVLVRIREYECGENNIVRFATS